MNKSNNVPQIRFKGFNDPWQYKKLHDVCDFLRGNSLSWTDIDNDGIYDCILYGHLYTHYGMIANKIFFKTNTIPKNPIYSCRGDVLIPSSDTTPTGLARATTVNLNGVLLGGDINVLRPKIHNGIYLSISLNKNRNKMIPLITGTTVRHLHNSSLKEIELYLSDEIFEQEKIGSLFEKLDNIISLQKEKHEQLQKIKKSLLENMFPSEGKDIPKIRFKGFNEKWRNCELRNITQYRTSSITTNEVKEEGKYPVYDANGFIGYTNHNFIDSPYITIIKDGSGVGRTRILNSGTYFIGTMGGILPKDSDINFIYTLLQGFDFSQYITGATIPHVYYSDYSKHEVMIATLKKEQFQIGQLFEKFDNLISLNQDKIEKLEKIKKSLLDKMFV